MSVLELAPPFTPTAKQTEFFAACVDPDAKQVLFDGAIRSGKTQACCRAVVEWALMHPGTTSLVARSTYRELEDSTKKVMLRGDGGLPPILDPQLVAEERASDNKVVLRNGSEILFRSLEEQNVGKVLGATYAAVFVDQIEELDSGPAGERSTTRCWGRLSDPNGPRKLIASGNPGPTTHWLYRRFIDPRTRGPRTRRVHVTLLDNAAHLPDDYLEAMLATKDTRPHWYRAFVLGEWGSFEGAAYTEFAEDVHVVAPFAVPSEWVRLEGMDHGVNNPTAWLLGATDFDGNLLVVDEYYRPGLIADHAAEVWRRRRESWWSRDGKGELVYATCFGDPSIRNRFGTRDVTGRELSVETEYADHGDRDLAWAERPAGRLPADPRAAPPRPGAVLSGVASEAGPGGLAASVRHHSVRASDRAVPCRVGEGGGQGRPRCRRPGLGEPARPRARVAQVSLSGPVWAVAEAGGAAGLRGGVRGL